MIGSRIRKLLALASLAALSAAALRVLRGEPTNTFGGGSLPTAPKPAGLLVPVQPISSEHTSADGAAEAAAAPTNSRSWVEPVDGTCPVGFEFKAKLTSGIYHRPGMSAYDRMNPDRCYPSEAAAEADGLRAAKR